MKLAILTIVLDGMRFLPAQFYTFNGLRDVDWTWYIAEGRADNVKCTKWCQKLPPRLSTDGTTVFLNQLSSHPRIRIFQRQLWPGKVSMFNTMLAEIKEPCWVLQVDVDEIWTAHNIEFLMRLMDGPVGSNHNCAQFYCRYFVGPNIVTFGPNAYGNRGSEWLRLFKFHPGMTFEKHEPPVMRGINDCGETNRGDPIPNESLLTRDETKAFDLIFDHYAYVYLEQVREKEKYYGYKNAAAQWSNLQRNTSWPALLKPYLPWVDDRATADLLHK